jgi:hypothetical protein
VQSDFDDTVMARPPRVAHPESAEPDTESTVVRKPAPQPLIEPATPPTGVWANSVSVPLEPETTVAESVVSPAAPREDSDRVVYGFRLGDSPIVTLDAVAYVGRRPSAPRVVHGGMPRLVRVESPDQEISATHIELRQTGPNVVVTDMRSTNGTRVISPDAPPRRLRQGESVVVTAGTLIDLGDSVVLEIVVVPESP